MCAGAHKEVTAAFSGSVPAAGCHVGSLELDSAGVDTPQELANIINEQLPQRQSKFTSTPWGCVSKGLRMQILTQQIHF